MCDIDTAIIDVTDLAWAFTVIVMGKIHVMNNNLEHDKIGTTAALLLCVDDNGAVSQSLLIPLCARTFFDVVVL